MLDLVEDGAVAVRDGMIVAAGPHRRRAARLGRRRARPRREPGAPSCPASSSATRTPCSPASGTPSTPSGSAARRSRRSPSAAAASGPASWPPATPTTTPSSTTSRGPTRSSSPAAPPRWRSSPGYGLSAESELRQLELLDRSRRSTPLQLVVSFLGAHVVPGGHWTPRATPRRARHAPPRDRPGYRRVPRHHLRARAVLAAQAGRLFAASRRLGIATKAHADAWATSAGLEHGGRRRRHLGGAPDLHARRGDPRDARRRHRRRAAPPGRAHLHDRPPRRRPALHRAGACRSRSRPTTARRSTPRRWSPPWASRRRGSG